MQRPNILLVMADQLAAPFLSAYGGPAITPAIDRLAAEGVVFQTAYSNSPESEVHERWDPGALKQAVLANQLAGADVDRALRRGRYVSWDYQPTTDAHNQYMRNHLDLNQVESSRRI